MRQRMIAVGLACLAAGVPGGAAEADPLARHRWTSRILVVSAPLASDPAARAQLAVADAARRSMAERDLVTLEAFGEGAEAVAVRRRLGLPGDGFRVVLVGKDGAAKLTSREPVSAETLASIIDAMPMRRDEMRR